MEQALQVAECGHGLAMGRRPLVDDWLDRGTLVAPFGAGDPTGAAYYLCRPADLPPTARPAPGALAARTWPPRLERCSCRPEANSLAPCRSPPLVSWRCKPGRPSATPTGRQPHDPGVLASPAPPSLAKTSADVRAPLTFITPSDAKPVFHSSALYRRRAEVFFETERHAVASRTCGRSPELCRSIRKASSCCAMRPRSRPIRRRGDREGLLPGDRGPAAPGPAPAGSSSSMLRAAPTAEPGT